MISDWTLKNGLGDELFDAQRVCTWTQQLEPTHTVQLNGQNTSDSTRYSVKRVSLSNNHRIYYSLIDYSFTVKVLGNELSSGKSPKAVVTKDTMMRTARTGMKADPDITRRITHIEETSRETITPAVTTLRSLSMIKDHDVQTHEGKQDLNFPTPVFLEMNLLKKHERVHLTLNRVGNTMRIRGPQALRIS